MSMACLNAELWIYPSFENVILRTEFDDERA